MNLTQAPFLVRIKEHVDAKGIIRILEDTELPFTVRRVFWLSEVPENTVRGGHAHHQSQQLLICAKGTIEVRLEDLTGRTFEYCLIPEDRALFIPPLVWGEFTFKAQAEAICLASDHFLEKDYIRDYRIFKDLQNAGKHR